MANFTSNPHQMKREILAFSNIISRHLNKPERKFIADMNFGILVPAVVCLPISPTTLTHVKKWCPSHPVVHIDNSYVVKPDGCKFESLG